MIISTASERMSEDPDPVGTIGPDHLGDPVRYSEESIASFRNLALHIRDSG